jgi:hypothetical protein
MNVRVVGQGVTTTSLEYYAEADPILLKMRAAFLAGKVRRDKVFESVNKIVGIRAVEKDMALLENKEPGTSAQIHEFLKWQEANPLRPRLYGSAGVVAALVLAPVDAKEVRVEYA